MSQLAAALPGQSVPDLWAHPVAATAAMVALAGLDFVGAVLAKRWAESGSLVAALAGAAVFLVLFGVYASSLRYAELAIVTVGWVVLLQVAILAFEHFGGHVRIPPDKLLAVVAILALQGYLVLAPSRG